MLLKRRQFFMARVPVETHTPDSDWDILVLLDKENIEDLDYKTVAYPLYDLGLEYDTSISVNLYTRKDWNKRSFTVFYKNVEKEGIVL